ncbi:hypothetical protein NPIL_620661 [Nephila pilipes]|uniref:Uncharacterized protein n=1 Tax=Nephila pilipes TaxID=299642 RepID=A0A8X6MRF0_NEPPI|nr:hypothetical protein NPIL_620661 [Nephila pilipes]
MDPPWKKLFSTSPKPTRLLASEKRLLRSQAQWIIRLHGDLLLVQNEGEEHRPQDLPECPRTEKMSIRLRRRNRSICKIVHGC